MTNQNRKQENHNSKNHDPANQCVACGNEMPEGDQVCAACRDGSSKSAITKITTIAEFLENLGERKMAAELSEAAQALKGERA